MKTGVELIAEERARQVAVEGWTAERDDAHGHGQLAMAAACYATPFEHRRHRPGAVAIGAPGGRVPELWPWAGLDWKPAVFDDERIRELTKAGALIAAEIDRLQRAERSKP